MNAATVIASNKKTIVLVSSVFVAGIALFWMLAPPSDAQAFYATLLLCSVAVGGSLGYRCCAEPQGQTLWSLAYPVSWRIGCIWVVLAALVESALTDGTVIFTLNNLTPYVFLATLLTTAAFIVGWVLRAVVAGASAVVKFEPLARGEWLAVIGIILAVIGIIVGALGLYGTLPEPPERAGFDPVSMSRLTE